MTPELTAKLRALAEAPEASDDPAYPCDWANDAHVEGAMLDAMRWQMSRFLSCLFAPYASEGFIEIKVFPDGRARNGRAEQKFIALPDIRGPKRRATLQTLWDWATERNAAGKGIFVGVLPRGRARGTARDVYRAGVAWADLDFKVNGRDAVMDAIAESDPDIVVLSGYGAHAYWYKSGDPVELTDANLRRFSKWVRAKQQAVMPGCDPVHDVSRVLRCPGFLNMKNPDDARVVTLAIAKKREK